MAGLLEANQVGKRELLADYITIVDAKDKPILAMIPKSRQLTNTLVRWQVDAYDSPNLAGTVDGQDVSDYENAAESRTELQTYCHFSRRTAKVSKLAEDVSVVAGAREGDMARSIRKKLEEIGRDIESVMGSSNAARADDGALGYETAGLGTWLSTTAYTPVDAANFHPTTTAISTTNAGSVVESDLTAVLNEVFLVTGQNKALDLVCGPKLKRDITEFTQVRETGTTTYASVKTYTTAADANKVISNVMVYEGDFHTVRLHPSLLLAQDGAAGAVQQGRGYVLDFDMLELRWNQMPTVTRNPDLGGGPRAVIDAVWALVVKNPKSLGGFKPTA